MTVEEEEEECWEGQDRMRRKKNVNEGEREKINEKS